ncbi:hypothetical protein T10_1020, partial [Trichinella papuae]
LDSFYLPPARIRFSLLYTLRREVLSFAFVARCDPHVFKWCC